MDACTAVVDEGVADPDPWRGFVGVVEKICAMHAVDRGFTAAFISAYPKALHFRVERERALRSFAELTDRAKAAGRLRPDFVLDDLILVLMANGGIRTTSRVAAVAASRRFAALMIQSFQAQPGNAELPPAVRLPLTMPL